MNIFCVMPGKRENVSNMGKIDDVLFVKLFYGMGTQEIKY